MQTFYPVKDKSKYVCFAQFEASFLVFVLNLGMMQNMHNQSVFVLWHYTIIIQALELKTFSFYVIILMLDLFFKWVSNATDSQDVSLSVSYPNMLL